MSIDYALAKELKEAGSPQDERQGYYLTPENFPYKPRSFNSEEAYVPTLSELIEACGEPFYELKKATSTIGLKWAAFDHRNGLRGEGATPKEAVARLWLALNKKV